MLKTVTLVVELGSAIGTVLAAWVAVCAYRGRVALERAKWMQQLYEKFYERRDLKNVRDVLDGNDPHRIQQMVSDEPSEFTDYLNFFEFIAWLLKSKQIRQTDVSYLLGYYLDKLGTRSEVAGYVLNPDNGFELLGEFLSKEPSEKGKK